MNEYSFIYLQPDRYIMARQIDYEKLDSIRRSTMKIIGEQGIEKTTVSMIAADANVSSGYLYRLYEGKDDLINSIYLEKAKSIQIELEDLLERHPNSIIPVIKNYVTNRINFAKTHPIEFRFYYLLVHNINYSITSDFKQEMLTIFEMFRSIGEGSGEMSPGINLFKLYYHLFVYVQDFINFKMINFSETQSSSEEDITYLTNNILKILKENDA